MSSQKSAAARALKSSVPIRERQADPNGHAILRWRMRDDGRDAAHTIRYVHDGGLYRGIRKRSIGEAFTWTDRHGSRIERVEQIVRGRRERRRARDKRDNELTGGVKRKTSALAFHGLAMC